MAEKRILCIVGGMNVGGAETFLMKIYRNLDREKYQMDFAVGSTAKGSYDDEITSLGGDIHRIVPKSRSLFLNFRSIYHVVREHNYKYVLRVSQHSLSALELLAAKIGGAEICAFRSSNSDTGGNAKMAILHKMCAFMPLLFSNARLAPSTEAAEFMFGVGCLKNNKANLLHNAVDIAQFRYISSARDTLRREMGVEKGTVLVGHIGRFDTQKNHTYLLEIFRQIQARRPDSKLLLVGKGTLEQQIREKAEALGIADNVIFTGVRSDIPALLSAMDVFVFPSLFEGMPNTVIEAQATGLPCVIADTITREADITGLVQYLSLNASPEVWADAALSACSEERKDTKQDFIDHHYDIQSTVSEFIRLCFQE